MHRRRQRAGALAVAGMLALLTLGMRDPATAETLGRIERIELKAEGASTKVIVMLSRPLAFDVKVLDGDAAKQSTRRLVLDFPDTTLTPEATKPIEVTNDHLRQVRPGQFNAKTARIVLDLAGDTPHSIEAFESPPHVTIALGAAEASGTAPALVPEAAKPAAVAAEEPKPTTAVSDATKSTPRTIPVSARGRRSYSLFYAR